ncbi:MAG: hypothetical protein WDW36_006421 [Sanguina aurantia]
MDFNLFKNLDKAFDFESIERTVASGVQQAAVLGIVDEFPDRKLVHQSRNQGSGGGAGSRHAQQSWDTVDLEGRKPEWEAICKELQLLQASETANPRRAVSANQWQQRARDSEYKLIQICSLLLPLPDPVPFMHSLAGVSVRVSELEEQNRALKSAADSVAADTLEVTELVAKHQKLEAAHRELQEQLQSQSAQVEEMSAAAGQAAAQSSLAAEQAAEISRLQALLRTLRDDHETGQTALFDLASRAELEGGSRAAEAELTLELLDRATTRVSDLEREAGLRTSEFTGGEGCAAGSAWCRGGGRGGGGGGGGEGRRSGAGSAGRGGRRRLLGAADGGQGGAGFGVEGTGLGGGGWRRGVCSVDFLARASSESAGRHELAMQSASNQLASADLNISRLEKELTKRPTAAVCQELAGRVESLQQLVGGELESEGWAPVAVQGLLSQPTAAAVSGVLQERIRKLSSDVSDLRRQLSDSGSANAQSASDLGSAVAELARQAQLITALERDLSHSLSAQQPSPGTGLPSLSTPSHHGGSSGGGSGGGGSGGGGTQRDPRSGSSSCSSGPDGLQPGGGSSHLGVLAGEGGSGGGGGGGSLLDIVVSQRERFRLRVTQLEEEAADPVS